MRIVWASHRDPWGPRAGGAEATIRELGRRFAAQGHSFLLVCGGGANLHEQFRAPEGFNVVRFRGNLLPHFALPWLLRGHPRAQVIVGDLAHVVPWSAGRLTRVPSVAFFHHLHRRTLSGQVSRPGAAALTFIEGTYPRLLSDALFITESPSARDDLIALGIPANRIRRIAPGVDAEVFRPQSRSISPQLVFFAGLRPYKRADHVIRALALVLEKSPSCTLTIVGTGPAVPSLRDLARRLGVGPAVRFTGRLSAEALATTVGTAWVNVNASYSEGWGFTILEAAAAGVPSVGYRVPGIVDSIEDGRTGLLVEGQTPEALAVGILDALEAHARLGAGAMRFAGQFSWDSCARMWERELRALVSDLRE